MPVPLSLTKHFRLAQELRTVIKALKPGQTMPTLEELKATYGASQATVDRAVNRLRREGLVHRPAGEKRLVISEVCEPATRRVAMIRPDWPSAVTDEILRSIAIAGRSNDWAFENVHYRTHDGLDLARAIGENDAAVLMTTGEPLPPRLMTALRSPRKPVVLVQDEIDTLRLPTVLTDDRRITEMFVEHLHSLGHRRILFVLPTQNTQTMREAVAGWQGAMERAGETALDELLIDTAVPSFEYPLAWSYAFLDRWMREKRVPFTAVIGGTGEIVMAMSRVLRENGLSVPGDVSITGSSGVIEWGPYLNPPLTSSEYEMSEYGQAVVDMLEAQFHGGVATDRVRRIAPRLVVRESTAPPRGDAGGA